jgi:nitrate reductase gamma subunit
MDYPWNLSFIAFAIYPYISLSFLIGGSIYRYVVNPHSWTSKSSEILEKEAGMFWGANFFHYGIILALLGHIAGLLCRNGDMTTSASPKAYIWLLPQL